MSWKALIGSLGIVYGDIGTSPLYALKSCFTLSGLPVTPPIVLGIISLFIWTLMIVVSVKYMMIVLKIDHHGDGGILVLSRLASSYPQFRKISLLCALLGTVLFFGDGVLTPAISVVSAIEGLAFLNPEYAESVVPLSLFVLTLLFLWQRAGSSVIGSIFGPIMLVWFVVLAFLGMLHTALNPFILKALSPYYALSFILNSGLNSWSVLGGVLLVVTGAEALYADMGHFGRPVIKKSWFIVVFPSLCLHYLGQGALILRIPEAVANPFYSMVSPLYHTPLIILSIAATIIASQSVLSGLFSLTYQAIQLDMLPRLKIGRTSSHNPNQIYVGVIDFVVWIFTSIAVVYFKNSNQMASAYGFCSASIMLLTTLLLAMVAYKQWKISRLTYVILFGILVAIDTIFFSTNIFKLATGGYFVLVIAAFFYFIITTWQKGRAALQEQRIIIDSPLQAYLDSYRKKQPISIPKTVMYLIDPTDKVPEILALHLHHHVYLQEKIFFLSLWSNRFTRKNVFFAHQLISIALK